MLTGVLYEFVQTMQADVFLAPQIHGLSEKFNFDMVGSALMVDKCWK